MFYNVEPKFAIFYHIHYILSLKLNHILHSIYVNLEWFKMYNYVRRIPSWSHISTIFLHLHLALNIYTEPGFRYTTNPYRAQ